MSGPPSRWQAFLMNLLGAGTQLRYRAATSMFDEYCKDLGVNFAVLNEEKQDYLLADAVLEFTDRGSPVPSMRVLVAALQKLYGGRRRQRTTFAVIEGLAWELLMLIVVVLVSLGRPGPATALLLSFCQLLRISEALRLRHCDVIFACTFEIEDVCYCGTFAGVRDSVPLAFGAGGRRESVGPRKWRCIL